MLVHDVIHMVDLLCYFGKHVKKVQSLIGQQYSFIKNHYNFYTALIEFDNRCVGLLNSNRTAGGRAIFFEIHSKGVSVMGNICGRRDVDYYMVLEDNKPFQEAEIIRNEQIIGNQAPDTHIDGSYKENRHFIDCIKEDKQPLINFAESSRTMQLIKDILNGPKIASY